MPRYDFLCTSCGHEFEETVPAMTTTIDCPHDCGRCADRLPVLIGGYRGNMGSASTRPKNSASKPQGKAFTGFKEPEQLEFDFEKKE